MAIQTRTQAYLEKGLGAAPQNIPLWIPCMSYAKLSLYSLRFNWARWCWKGEVTCQGHSGAQWSCQSLGRVGTIWQEEPKTSSSSGTNSAQKKKKNKITGGMWKTNLEDKHGLPTSPIPPHQEGFPWCSPEPHAHGHLTGCITMGCRPPSQPGCPHLLHRIITLR